MKHEELIVSFQLHALFKELNLLKVSQLKKQVFRRTVRDAVNFFLNVFKQNSIKYIHLIVM